MATNSSAQRNEELVKAADRGNLAEVKRLLRAGADVNSTFSWGSTALHRASTRGYRDVVETLLQAGADHSLGDWDGQTALHLSSWDGHRGVVEDLLLAGADHSLVDTDGRTALHDASISGYRDVVEDLLKAGANHSLVDTLGKTPRMRAREEGRTEVVRLLELHQQGQELPELKLEAVKGSPTTKFQYGSDHTMTLWSSKAKERLADMCVMRILTAGDVEAGKSSMVLSLLNNQAYLTEKADRTEMVDCWNWTLPEGKVVAIYDLGGHPAYYYTSNYFHFDSVNNVILLCHSLLSETYSKTFQWVKAIVSRSPKSHIIPVLTKADQATDEAERQQRKLQFITAFQELLKNELSEIDDIISRNTINNLPIYDSLHKKYSSFSNSLSELVFLTSSAVDNDSGMISLSRHIIKMSKSSENTVKILQEFKEFYMENGVMGVDDEHMEGPTGPTGDSKDISAKPKEAPSTSSQKQPSKQVANKEKPLMSEQREHHLTAASIPPQATAIRAKIVMLENAQKVYDIIAKRNRVDKNGLRKCLLCLHSYGMLLWFEGNPQLEKIIFNDISFFKEILKAVFHHNALQFLQFQSLDSALRNLFKNQSDFEKQVKMLTSQGIMTKYILQVLLSKSNFSDTEFVMHLLEKLNVAYIMPTNKNNINNMFIPYYIDQAKIPIHVSSLITHLAKCSTHEMAVVLSVTGNFPSTFWHNLCVRLVKRLEDHAIIQERVVFVDGFWARLDNIYIYVKFENGKNVVVTARCTVEDCDHVKSLWDHLKGIWHNGIEDIINKWWPGIITNQVINCPHCFLRKRPYDQRSTWDITELLSEPPNYSFHCDCEPQINLPAALIKPLASDEKMAKKQLSDLQKFLQMFGTKKDIIQVTAPDQTAKQIPKIRDMSDKSLNTVAREIGHDWKNVGYTLNFTKAQLEKIEHDNPHSLIDINTTMLIEWRQRQEGDHSVDQTLNKLYSTFEECKLEVESNLIEEPESISAAPGPNVAPPQRTAAKTTAAKLPTQISEHRDNIQVTEPDQTAKLTGNIKHALPADNKLNQEQSKYIWDEIGPSVCRITGPGCTGTGFVVGSVQHRDTKQEHFFILTCYHVKIQDAIHPCYAEFGYTHHGQLPKFKVKIRQPNVACDVNLDYILVALDYEPQLLGFVKTKMGNLIPTGQRPLPKDPLIIIGHPEGKELQLDPAPYCIPRPDNTNQPHEYIFYQCHSFHGASGAPVMSKDKRLLYAMHCGGYTEGQTFEYGATLWEVLKDIKQKANTDSKLYVAKSLFPELYNDHEDDMNF